MKKYISLTLFIVFPVLCFSQENNIEFDTSKFLKEVTENACKCVDSVATFNKSDKQIASGINSCIDKQVMVYQMGMKLASVKNEKDNDGKQKNVNIKINTNPESEEYTKYYYEIERDLMADCDAVKYKIAANDKLREKSMSSDPEAGKYYNLGLDEFEKENYAKAIEYYKKALVYDSDFAFAYDNIGISYRKLNKFDEAIAAYEKSLEIDPYGTMPLQNIAVAYTYKEQYKKAIKAYERLAKLDSKNPEVFFGIGNIYAQALFDYERALENLCQAYNIYVEQKSPYRTDAEKLIQIVYNEMKKQGKEATFNQILTKYKISPK